MFSMSNWLINCMQLILAFINYVASYIKDQMGILYNGFSNQFVVNLEIIISKTISLLNE
jgi:hypothetical protein